MILTSLSTGEKYFWVKVPRTGTVSYQNFFLKYYSGSVGCPTHDPALGNLHTHYSYENLCKLYEIKLPGITVVRNPLERFISGLHQLKLLSLEQKFDVSFLDDMKSCIKFLQTHFSRNCYTVSDFQDLFLNSDPSFTQPFFKLQISLMYHPKVSWFKYENIEKFNEWIINTLDYDVSLLSRENQSVKKILSNLNFSDPKFIETVENMFYDDYKVLDYPFQYLT